MQSTEEITIDPAECKKIIEYLAKKFKLSILIRRDVTERHGYVPVKETLDSNSIAIDVEYFASQKFKPHYNSIGVWTSNDWKQRHLIDDASEFLSAESNIGLKDAYADLVCILRGDDEGIVLTKSGDKEEIICEIPPFSSFAELKMKLDVIG